MTMQERVLRPTFHRFLRSKSAISAMAKTAKNLAVQLNEPAKGKTDRKEVLRVAELDAPSASENKVLVKMLARPVNPSDVASVQGIYPGFNRSRKYPAIPGLEGVGVIEENGASASRFQKGQRVISTGWGAADGCGTWQQYVAVSEDHLFAVPDSVPDEVAAQAVVNPITCYGFLDTLKIPKGAWFIQNAANSEVGLMMVALCKSRGIKTINIVRRQEAADLVKSSGGDETIVDSEEADIPKRVKEITGGELAYGATDAVCADQTGKLASSVRPGGMVLVYGAMGGIASMNISIRDTLFRGVIVTGFWLSRYLAALDAEGQKKVVHEILDLLAKGVLKPRTGEKFSLERVSEAVEASEKPSRKGKVLLVD